VSSVAFGGGGESKDRVDVQDAATLTLEGSNEKGAPDAVAPHGLVRPPMKVPPPLRGGLVPFACGGGIDPAAEGSTMPMVA
jgi:hypothetical protein